MRNQIYKNKEFYILSRSIDNASKCKVTEVLEDCFKVELAAKNKYEEEESVELFTMTPNGQLYFETIVKEVKENIISIWFPISYKYLQRREFSRINLERNIILKLTKEQLQLLKKYEININIENKPICVNFEPIRTETNDNTFISSGRFKDISSFDRISLVQYCFRKQIENSNK